MPYVYSHSAPSSLLHETQFAACCALTLTPKYIALLAVPVSGVLRGDAAAEAAADRGASVQPGGHQGPPLGGAGVCGRQQEEGVRARVWRGACHGRQTLSGPSQFQS